MDIINKNINIEDNKSRIINSHIPVVINGEIVKTNNNWGMIPCDILIMHNIYGDGIPMHKEGMKKRIRYRTLITIYDSLIQLCHYCEYYKICNENGNIKFRKIEKEFEYFWELKITHLFKTDSKKNIKIDGIVYNIGDIICEIDEIKYNFFIKTFWSIDKAHNFFNLVYDLITIGKHNEVTFKPQYLNVPIYLEESIYEGGKLNIYEKEWDPNNLYLETERVIKDNNIWTLNKRDIELKTNAFRSKLDMVTKKPIFLTEDKIEREDPYVWGKIEIEGDNYDVEYSNKNGILDTLLRKRMSYDDNNNKLPFIVSDEGDIELEVLLGKPINVKTYNNIYYCDYILDITLINGNKKITLNNEKYNNGIIKIDEWFYDYNIIQFTFIKNGILENESIINGGIKYVEQYTFSSAVLTNIMINGEKRNFVYPYIGELINSISTFSQECITNNLVNLTYFKDDMLLGVHDVKIEESNIYINRGKSSAFERRSILGEVATFEDLENYKNDLFKIRNI